MGIRLTEEAGRHLERQLQGQPDAVGIRLGVKEAGCSGLRYVVQMASAVEPADVVFEERGVRLIVAADSLPYIDGTEVDLAAEGLARTLRFHNPHATASCGCGESFAVRGR
jgi:iron-sulfur cluster assembly protein